MKNHLKHFLLFAVLAVCSIATAVAQATLKGKIVDADTQEPLIGATVTVKGTIDGTVTDMDGNFVLKVKGNKVTLAFSYVGYNELNQNLKISGKTMDLGTVALTPDAIGLEEVSVIASIIKSDRQTPIPISNVKLATIEEKVGNLEFPELLKSTPSVYVTRESGGYGDSRINMRGFDSSNLGILINGVPINGMENGKVYWSNWSGLSDVSQFVQVQRGLGASALGLSSVGGTMNMVTKSTEAKKGGSAYFGIGNDGFRKYSVSVSTGLMDNGWAVTLMGALNTGDGYVKGTNYEGWTYFGNISKVINSHHKLSLTAFGAPQWHNQRSTPHYIEDYKNSPDGGRFSNSYGYLNGELTGGAYGYNYYHKPQVSLNHYWTINEQSSLTTSLYASMATGGGRRVRGAQSNWLAIDNNTGRPYEETKLTAGGLLDYDAVLAENAANPNGSQAIFTNAVNDHDWYGVLSSYKNRFTEKFTFTGGFDGRYYKGYHKEVIDNLLGGAYYMPGSKHLDYEPANAILKEGVVDRNKIFADVAEILGNHLRIFSKPLHHVRVLPAAPLIKRLWEFPVKQRQVWRDAVLLHRENHITVHGDRFLIHATGSLRQNPRPVQRKTVRADSQMLHQRNIFFIMVHVIAACVCILMFKHPPQTYPRHTRLCRPLRPFPLPDRRCSQRPTQNPLETFL